jgi:hypothetical protein
MHGHHRDSAAATDAESFRRKPLASLALTQHHESACRLAVAGTMKGISSVEERRGPSAATRLAEDSLRLTPTPTRRWPGLCLQTVRTISAAGGWSAVCGRSLWLLMRRVALSLLER